MSSGRRCTAITTRGVPCRNLATVGPLCTLHHNRMQNNRDSEVLLDDITVIMSRFGIQAPTSSPIQRRRFNPFEVPFGFRPTSTPRVNTQRLSQVLDSQNRSPRSGEDDCVICLDTPANRINVKCCKKPFCKKCIKKALIQKSECPACRTPKAGFDY